MDNGIIFIYICTFFVYLLFSISLIIFKLHLPFCRISIGCMKDGQRWMHDLDLMGSTSISFAIMVLDYNILENLVVFTYILVIRVKNARFS